MAAMSNTIWNYKFGNTHTSLKSSLPDSSHRPAVNLVWNLDNARYGIGINSRLPQIRMLQTAFRMTPNGGRPVFLNEITPFNSSHPFLP